MTTTTDDSPFGFGRNWRQFLQLLDEERVAQAERSLVSLLGTDTLEGLRFLDIGCGSGLFSLAAHRSGAVVHSFDYDPESVACAEELRRRFAHGTDRWVIEPGSVLDPEYLSSLGTFDVVYSWGVLHHTGDLWQALAGVENTVASGGLLCLAIYNDQGGASRRWARIKKWYNRVPRPVQWLMLVSVGGYWEARAAVIRVLRFQNPLPFADWRAKKQDRGMSAWYDLVDWVGGFPFEVARPEAIFDFYRRRGFVLEHLTTQGGGHGCNEFTFRRSGD